MQTNYLNKSYHSKKGSTSNFISSPQNSTIQLNTNKQMELLTARCPVHQGQILTNYCTSYGCLVPLCPDCIQRHLDAHKQSKVSPDIFSIKQVRLQGIDKLTKLINFIVKELESLEPPKSIDKIVSQTNYKLRSIKESVQRTIDEYFASLQNHLISRVRESQTILKRIQNSHLIMEKMLGQLKNLSQILRLNDESTAGTIKKVMEIDQTALLSSFNSELEQYEIERNKIGINVEFQQTKFRQNIDKYIKVAFTGSIESSYSTKSFGLQMQDCIRYKKNPYLHFFEAGSSNLHLLDLPSLNRRLIPLKSSFIIPHFHNSLLLSNGDIWLSGGSYDDNPRKNTSISRYSTLKQSFQTKITTVMQRSSHSSIQCSGHVYLIGGYGSDDSEGGLVQVQKVNIETGKSAVQTPCKFGGSCILTLRDDNIFKISAEGIQVYNTRRKAWSQIYVPNFVWYQSCTGISINHSEILVFGGYEIKDENDPGRPMGTSFIIDIKNLNQVRIKDKGKYDLPIGGGFRNSPVMFCRQIYALQNIQETEGEDLSTNCLDGDRTLLKFDGKKWQDINI